MVAGRNRHALAALTSMNSWTSRGGVRNRTCSTLPSAATTISGDDGRQERVLDQVLALFLTNETNDQILHFCSKCAGQLNGTEPRGSPAFVADARRRIR